MAVECLAIIAIILMVCVVFLRARKVDYALLTGILLIVPAVHFLAQIFGKSLASMLSVEYMPLAIAIDMLAVVVSCLMLGFTSNRLSSGRQRKTFMILACSYSVILTWVFIFNIFSQK